MALALTRARVSVQSGQIIVVGRSNVSAALALEVGGRASAGVPQDLAGVGLIVLVDVPEDPFHQVRAWRAAGHRVPVVVWCPKVPEPDDRGALQPLTIAREGASLAVVISNIRFGEQQGTLVLSGGVVDLDRGVFQRSGSATAVQLTRLEADLLAYMAARSGREIQRDELQQQVWGHRRATTTRAVDMSVSRLRKKIERDPANPDHLITRRGGGYRLLLAQTADPPPEPPAEPALSLFGRSALVDSVRSLLAGPDRLLTLVGPPGAGKTSLAEVVLANFKLPSLRCDLVPVTDDRGVALQMASVLGLDTGAGADLAAVRAHIGRDLQARGRCVVLLDNAEHLVDAVAEVVSEWGDLAPMATFMVTSQSPLALMDERIVTVPTLDRAAAVAMLVDRCARRGVDVLSDDPELVGIVELLDGLPLAIDLAAGRVRTMGLAGVREALAQDLGVLKDRSRDREGRHATLRGALSVAWDRLDGQARSTLAQLSAFRGDFDFAAARAVVRLRDGAVAEHVERLIDQSLVQVRRGSLRLLAPVRSFILDVSLAEVISQAAARHARWAADLGLLLAGQTRRVDGVRALERLSAMSGELQAGFGWAELNGDRDSLANLAIALDRLYFLRGDLSTRLRWLDRAIAPFDSQPHDARLIRLARLRAQVAQERGDLKASLADLERSAALAREFGLSDEEARSLVVLADHQRTTGDLQAAAVSLDRAAQVHGQDSGPLADLIRGKILHVAHYQAPNTGHGQAIAEMLLIGRRLEEAGETWMAVQLQFMLCTVLHNAGDRAALRAARLHLLDLHDRSPMRRREGIVLCHVGLGLLQDERFEEADVPMVKAIRALERSNQTVRALLVGYFRALGWLHQGRHEEALADFSAQRAALSALGMRRGVAHAAEGIALVYLDQGDVAVAKGALAAAHDHADGSHDQIMLADISMYVALADLLEGNASRAAQRLDGLGVGDMPPDHAVVGLGLRAAVAHHLGEPTAPWLSAFDDLLTRPEGMAYAKSLRAWRAAVADVDQARLIETMNRAALPARLLARAWLVPPAE